MDHPDSDKPLIDFDASVRYPATCFNDASLINNMTFNFSMIKPYELATPEKSLAQFERDEEECHQASKDKVTPTNSHLTVPEEGQFSFVEAQSLSERSQVTFREVPSKEDGTEKTLATPMKTHEETLNSSGIRLLFTTPEKPLTQFDEDGAERSEVPEEAMTSVQGLSLTSLPGRVVLAEAENSLGESRVIETMASADETAATPSKSSQTGEKSLASPGEPLLLESPEKPPAQVDHEERECSNVPDEAADLTGEPVPFTEEAGHPTEETVDPAKEAVEAPTETVDPASECVIPGEEAFCPAEEEQVAPSKEPDPCSRCKQMEQNLVDVIEQCRAARSELGLQRHKVDSLTTQWRYYRDNFKRLEKVQIAIADDIATFFSDMEECKVDEALELIRKIERAITEED